MPERNHNITFEIKEHLGEITRSDNGWTKELNIISWNGGTPKYDIRDWDPHHERMKKGITLHGDEMRRVVDLYLTNNSEKAVEKGKAMEAERRARRDEQRRSYQQQKEQPWQEPLNREQTCPTRRQSEASQNQPPELAAAERDIYEGACPPEPELPEGADIDRETPLIEEATDETAMKIADETATETADETAGEVPF